MGKNEIKIKKNRKFWFNLKAFNGQVIFTSIIIAFILILCAGCNKIANDEADVKEDLSYLYQTYNRRETNNNVYEERWTFDGYKETSYKYYINGQLYGEKKNYSYDGLNVIWDYYWYGHGDINEVTERQHVECEYLDNTFRRKTYQKTEYYYHENPQNDHIYEGYWEYDGKRIIGYQSYYNGILFSKEHDYNYDGLRCTYQVTHYSFLNVVDYESSYDVEFFDNSYFRYTKILYTTVYSDERPPRTHYAVYDYDGKKFIGGHVYENGELYQVSRDFEYNGLTCHYYYEKYRDGEVYATESYEIKYLE